MSIYKVILRIGIQVCIGLVAMRYGSGTIGFFVFLPIWAISWLCYDRVAKLDWGV